MEYESSHLRELAARWLEPSRVPSRIRVFTDTSDFYRVDYDDVVILGDRPYLVRNNEREGRFGIDEQQKFWVKRALDLTDGSKKVIKLVFRERFKAKVGPLIFDCVRSPAKEARVLSAVEGHPNFMQGFSVLDTSGNLVRVIDYIQGKRLPDYVLGLSRGHGEYFMKDFPSILRRYVEAVEALAFLHRRREVHGDIRRDHLIIDGETGSYRWIDFDFIARHDENKFGYDIFGLGNILVFLAGGGDVTTQSLQDEMPEALEGITNEDVNIIFHNRVVNLKKVFPYLPDSLNYVLLHFSLGAEVFYDSIEQFLDDLLKAESALANA